MFEFNKNIGHMAHNVERYGGWKLDRLYRGYVLDGGYRVTAVIGQGSSGSGCDNPFANEDQGHSF